MFPGVDSVVSCQKICADMPECVYFLYAFHFQDCYLLDSMERDCDFLVWPKNPTLEECKGEITTTTTVTSSTTATPSMIKKYFFFTYHVGYVYILIINLYFIA